MNEKLKEAINDIMDTFAGADGGISFVNLRSILENMDKEAGNGNLSAQEILEVVYRFHRLVKMAQGRK